MSNRQTALVTLEQVTVATAFNKYQDQIVAAIDSELVDPVRFMRVAMTVIRRTPKLEKCTLASILGAFVQTGQLGLYPDDLRGYVFLIPFYNTIRDENGDVLGKAYEAELMVGYQGWIELFRQSGFAAMNAVEGRVAYGKDAFSFGYAMKEGKRADWYEHIPSDEQDPGPMTHAYSVLNYKDSTSAFSVISRAQAEAHRNEYAKTKGKSGPWYHDMQFGEMAIKTSIRKATKYAPSSPAMRTAAALEERGEAGVSQQLDALIEIQEKAQTVVDLVPTGSSSSPPAQKRGQTSKMSEFLESQGENQLTKTEDGTLVNKATGEVVEEESLPQDPPHPADGDAPPAEEKKKAAPKPAPEPEPPKEPDPPPKEVSHEELDKELAAKEAQEQAELDLGKGKGRKD